MLLFLTNDVAGILAYIFLQDIRRREVLGRLRFVSNIEGTRFRLVERETRRNERTLFFRFASPDF